MHTPQIIYVVVSSIGLLITANEHGKPRKPTNFWTTFFDAGIAFGLLIWGGFFN